MIYTIEFTTEVERVIRRWKKSNPIAFRKLYLLLPELAEHPRTGTGHPEALKGGNKITYSRRLTAHDRIVYDVLDDVVKVIVLDAGGHYNDK